LKDKATQVVEKKKKERFELVPSFLSGIQLKFEPGTNQSNLLPENVKLFCRLAETYNRKQWKVESTIEDQRERKKEIINIVKASNGFRGIISEKDNFSLTVFPSKKIIWDREKLKHSLKGKYPLAVREKRTITVTIPNLGSSEKDEKLIEKAIRGALANVGIGIAGMSHFIHKEIGIDVDEEELNKIVSNTADGKIELLPKTKKVEVIWKVRLEPIKS